MLPEPKGPLAAKQNAGGAMGCMAASGEDASMATKDMARDPRMDDYNPTCQWLFGICSVMRVANK